MLCDPSGHPVHTLVGTFVALLPVGSVARRVHLEIAFFVVLTHAVDAHQADV